jgi:phosphinothricin acetyltransferase
MTLEREQAGAPGKIGRVGGPGVRPATAADLARINEIYNYYIERTAVTFDLAPWTMDQREAWAQQFAAGGRHRLFVAEDGGGVMGCAWSHQFRPKAAYETTVETSVYCAPEATGRGAGTALYHALFEALAGEDLQMAVAGITLPNEASAALHRRFGFVPAGLLHAVGRKFDRYWDVAWFEKPLR